LQLNDYGLLSNIPQSSDEKIHYTQSYLNIVKTLTERTQEIKTSNQKPQMPKSQHRSTSNIKTTTTTRQHASSKSQQFTIKDLNDSEADDISNNELKRT
jgi:hypothetical protein